MVNDDSLRILIVDDEAPIREVMSQNLRDEGYVVATAEDGTTGLELMSSFSPHVVFLDVWMPGSMDGVQVLQKAKKRFPELLFVMISGHGTIETAVKATKLGAWDFIEKPLSMDRILITITNLREYMKEREQKKGLLAQFQKQVSLVGSSRRIEELREKITKLASHLDRQAIMILGEKGSGRRLVAQNLHFQSSRAGGPFVEIHAGNIPVDLFDYEVWGWSRGVLAGHSREGVGKVELAFGGTLFVRSAESIPMASQILLAKNLQQKVYRKMGQSEVISLGCAVILSVDASLYPTLAEELKSICLVVENPPLRERLEDLPALFWHFSDQWIREEGGVRRMVTPAAMEELKKYSWPGNLTEFRNFVERLYLLSPGPEIQPHDLYFAGLPQGAGSPFVFKDFRQARAEFEKQFLIEKLKENGGNISRTAEAIGLERSYLHRKLKSYDIHIDD